MSCGEVEIGKRFSWSCSTSCLAFYFNKWGRRNCDNIISLSLQLQLHIAKKREKSCGKDRLKKYVHIWNDLVPPVWNVFWCLWFWAEKTSNPFTYGDHDQWPLSSTDNDFMGGNAEIRTGICSSMKHQNLRYVSRLCYWFSSCFRVAEGLCLSYVRQRVHNCWSRYINLLLLGMS